MIIIKTCKEIRAAISQLKKEGKTVALVPTMGNLHEGHLRLVARAKELADVTVATIFVNPTQFDRKDDLDNYPKTIDADCQHLKNQDTDIVFILSSEEIYPRGFQNATFVEVPILSDILEGQHRPKHFRGVASVVARLFNIIRPDVAIFGEKDYQQLQIINKMAVDLGYDIEIVGVATVRSENGLALSSRNNLLERDQLVRAPMLYKIMTQIGNKLTNGNTDVKSLVEEAELELRSKGFEPDGIFVVDAESLVDLSESSRKAVVLFSAFLGQVRLIDNMVVALK